MTELNNYLRYGEFVQCAVEGPMANDTVWNYVNDFLSGRITRKQFWVLAEFKYPTHQMSFHTLSALDCLTFEGSEVVYDRKTEK